MKTFYLIAGTKGGIGKTFIATLLADMALQSGKKVVLYDCDDENHTLEESYPVKIENLTVNPIAIDSARDMDYPLDQVINDIISQEEAERKENCFYVADMKAGTSARTMQWMEGLPYDWFLEKHISIVLIGVVTSEIDSVATLAVWIRTYLDDIRNGKLHLVVIKNDVMQTDFDYYDAKLHPALKNLPSVREIVLPAMSIKSFKNIRGNKSTVGQVAGGIDSADFLLPMERYRCRHYFQIASEALKDVFEPFEQKESS